MATMYYSFQQLQNIIWDITCCCKKKKKETKEKTFMSSFCRFMVKSFMFKTSERKKNRLNLSHVPRCIPPRLGWIYYALKMRALNGQWFHI
jgi:hypothetical protein